jgi:phage tail-like protein
MADAKAPQAAAKTDSKGPGTPNPYRKYNYRITIAEGGIIGHFTRCDGLELVTERVSYAEGGGNQDGRIYQLPGQTQYLPVTLHYGIINNDSLGLWTWMESTRKQQRDKRSVMLDFLGPDANDVYGYVLEEAWICRWKGGEMDGGGREYAVEQISIAYDAISRGKR